MKSSQDNGKLGLARLRVRAAGQTVAWFLIFGILWIVVTTGLGDRFIKNPEAVPAFELIKGIVFVILSALIIYYSIARHAVRLLAAEIEASDRLTTSERSYQMLIDAIRQHLIVRLQSDGTIDYWNTGATAVTGYPRNEAIGQHFGILFSEESRAAGEPEKLLKAAAEQGELRSVGRRVRKDGTSYFCESLITAVRNDRGELICFSKIGWDLTEEIEHQIRLKSRLHQYKVIAELGEIVIRADPAPRIDSEILSGIGQALEADVVALVHSTNDHSPEVDASWVRGSLPIDVSTLPAEELQEIAKACPQFVAERVRSLEKFEHLTELGFRSGISVAFTGQEVQWCVTALFVEPTEFTIDDSHFLSAISRIFENFLSRGRQMEEIRRREHDLKMLYDQIPAIVWTADENLIVQSTRGSGLSRIGLEPNRSAGQNVRDLVEPDVAAKIERAARGESQEYYVQFAGATLRTRVEPLRSPDGTIAGVVGVSVDVTEEERRRLELEEKRRALEKLSAQQFEVLESERERIARELHDELGGILTALYFDATRLREKGEDQWVVDKASEMSHRIETASKRVREVAKDLRPKIIDDFGLIPALEDLVHDFSEQYAIEANLSVRPPDVELKNGTDIVIYRIVQEALTNVARHSGADRADIRLRVDDESIVTEVRDNGRGIDPAMIESVDSLGIIGMKERAEILGGTFTVEPFEGKGTIVRVHIPLP